MDIVFIRHGRTNINNLGRYGGSLDSDMVPDGIEEINILKNKLDCSSFDGIYVSPLRRTIQTAEILTDRYSIDNRLREINFGKFEGLNYMEVYEKYPKESKLWEKDYLNYKLPDGESMMDVFNRTREFINFVSKKHERVLAITHGGVIRSAMSLVFDSYDYFYKFKVNHGSASIICIEDNYMYIKGINCLKDIEIIMG